MTDPGNTERSDRGVPLVDLGAQLAPIRAEIDAALARVLDSGRFILGPEVEALEREIATFVGCRHAIGVSSGTDALLVALMAIDLGAGDEVITTPFSFFATAGCVARLGARPVFVDISPDSYHLDASQIEAAITARTRAIVPVHLYGQCAAMDAIGAVAQQHGLELIEDAAQALGAEGAGRRAGCLGHIGCFSFFPTKNLGALGDGGMVATDDDALAERLRMLRNHGFSPKYHSRRVGGNFRLDALQAAALRVKLKHLEGWNAARTRHAGTYRQLFEDRGLACETTATRGVVLPSELPQRPSIYHQYVIRVPATDRDPLRDWLRQRAIGTEVYYPAPLHLQECFKGLGHQSGDFPEAERAAVETLALPIYAELTDTMLARVVAAIEAYFTSA